jgi:hypothetical protein
MNELIKLEDREMPSFTSRALNYLNDAVHVHELRRALDIRNEECDRLSQLVNELRAAIALEKKANNDLKRQVRDRLPALERTLESIELTVASQRREAFELKKLVV